MCTSFIPSPSANPTGAPRSKAPAVCTKHSAHLFYDSRRSFSAYITSLFSWASQRGPPFKLTEAQGRAVVCYSAAASDPCTWYLCPFTDAAGKSAPSVLNLWMAGIQLS